MESIYRMTPAQAQAVWAYIKDGFPYLDDVYVRETYGVDASHRFTGKMVCRIETRVGTSLLSFATVEEALAAFPPEKARPRAPRAA
jgi:hypothetical protein